MGERLKVNAAKAKFWGATLHDHNYNSGVKLGHETCWYVKVYVTFALKYRQYEWKFKEESKDGSRISFWDKIWIQDSRNGSTAKHFNKTKWVSSSEKS